MRSLKRAFWDSGRKAQRQWNDRQHSVLLSLLLALNEICCPEPRKPEAPLGLQMGWSLVQMPFYLLSSSSSQRGDKMLLYCSHAGVWMFWLLICNPLNMLVSCTVNRLMLLTHSAWWSTSDSRLRLCIIKNKHINRKWSHSLKRCLKKCSWTNYS